MHDLRIRSIESSHLADLIMIAEETNLNRWTAEHYFEELKNPQAILLRLESPDNQTIAFIVGRLIPSSSDCRQFDAEIYNIGVRPEFQRKGFGQRILEAFLAVCDERGAGEVWLEVREGNSAAVGLYAKNGFRPVAVRPDFYSEPRENGVLMCRKSLDASAAQQISNLT